MISLLKNRSTLGAILELIHDKHPMQEKRLTKELSKKDAESLTEAEEIATGYLGFLKYQGMSLDDAVDAYVKLCRDMIGYQIEFARTGEYPSAIRGNVNEELYQSETEMTSYMVGLGLSQFLWKTHHQMFQFFSRYTLEHKRHISSYLEIGPGHGLYLKRALNLLNKDVRVTAIDISPISLAITKKIIEYFEPGREVRYSQADIRKYVTKEKFDLIAMGEVLEHVDDPSYILKRVRELLAPEGRMYISTCANAPAIDHLFHFKLVDEIKSMIKNAGFFIETESILSVEEQSMAEIIKKKITINYCAIIGKATA